MFTLRKEGWGVSVPSPIYPWRTGWFISSSLKQGYYLSTMNFRCPGALSHHSLCLRPPHPHSTHIHITGGLPCFRGICLSLGIWVLPGHHLLRGKSRLFSWHLWSTVNQPQLSSFPHFFLLYTDFLFSLPRGTPPFLLLPFLHVSVIWNVPLSQLLFSSCLYLPHPERPNSNPTSFIILILLHTYCGPVVPWDLYILFLT